VGLGVYGTFSYGEAYNTYRGFSPPVDPVGVAPGHLYHEKFYSPALGEQRRFLVYTPPGYPGAAARGARFPVLYLLHGSPGRPSTSRPPGWPSTPPSTGGRCGRSCS
jgi:hypothetical protein